MTGQKYQDGRHLVPESPTSDLDLDNIESFSAIGLHREKLDKAGKMEKPKIKTEEKKTELKYKIQDSPPVMIVVMSAFQHILLSMSGCLSTSQVVADVACVPYDHPMRSHLFCTTIFMVGICTLMQTAIGVRLPIFQGPSSSFLVPLLALGRDPKWKCSGLNQPRTDHVSNNLTQTGNSSADSFEDSSVDSGILWRIQEMSGALILASLIEVAMGASGMLKYLLRFIGPITIACTISLIGVSLFRLPIIYGRANFPLAIFCMMLVLLFVLYLKDVSIPLPRCSKGEKNKRSGFPIFLLLPILLSVVIVWVLTAILTACNVFTDNPGDVAYLARADAKFNIIANSSWFQLTYPGQFGFPRISVALTLGFLVACFSSMIESVGDYYAAQKVCQTPSIPDHAISRGILVEGIGSILSASVGAGHATTSYSGNIAVLSLTQTASRVVMYTAGVLLLAFSCLGKVGASFTTMPNPILGGVLMVIVSTLVTIGLANLKDVDMTSSRNILVVGVPFMSGIVIPACLDMYPNLIETGNEEADRVIQVFLGTPMFFGGLLALILDSTVPGSRASRGFQDVDDITVSVQAVNHALEREDSEDEDETLDHESSVYSWASYPRLVRVLPFLGWIPFMPSGRGVSKREVNKDYKDEVIVSRI